MKKKTVLIIIIVAVLFLDGGLVFEIFYHSKVKFESKPKEEVTEKDEKPKEPFSNEIVEIATNPALKNSFDILNTYGKKIYDEKLYTSYSKKDDMYFISLADLNKIYGYDISVFKDEKGNVCDVEESGIYFDIDNHLKLENTEYFDPIIPDLIGCYV